MNQMTRRCNKRNRKASIKEYKEEVVVPAIYAGIALFIVFYSVFSN